VYIVTFKFPDNSEKEFQIPGCAYPSAENSSEDFRPENLPSSLLNWDTQRFRGKFYVPEGVLLEGDKGWLTYREIRNIDRRIKNESKRWKGRLFVSFEKDS